MTRLEHAKFFREEEGSIPLRRIEVPFMVHPPLARRLDRRHTLSRDCPPAFFEPCVIGALKLE
jgi:hypothetical protein